LRRPFAPARRPAYAKGVTGHRSDPTILWQPSAEAVASAAVTAFGRQVEERAGRPLPTYDDLWRWSVQDLPGFWGAVWDLADPPGAVRGDPVLDRAAMPGARWFPGSRLNYAASALAHPAGARALVALAEARDPVTVTYGELAQQVGAAAAGLRRLGVGPGDRVAAYLPNGSEAVVAMLAVASLGAVWSAAAPETGPAAALDRFGQIDPVVLLATDGYRYGGRDFDRRDQGAAIAAGLPSLRAVVRVPHLGAGRPAGAPGPPAGTDGRAGVPTVGWGELCAEPAAPVFEPVAFDHPLWILYSSGTTGAPKPIVHGHGGMLLEQAKYLRLHVDLRPSDVFFWFTTTGWMMWNFVVGGLLVGSTIVLYDGSPVHPGPEALWAMAAEQQITVFGTSAPFLMAQRRSGLDPASGHDLSAVRMVGSTGAPLPPEGFDWVYQHVGRDLLLGSISGGTDVCTAFVGSCPVLPVYRGEIQCRALGAAVAVYDEAGRAVVGQVGELVITRPMPCMPVGLWGDPDMARYRASYFDTYPGVWRHGDWAELTERGSLVIAGRSDSTLNRGGVRMGTAEFYRLLETVDGVDDALVVDTTGAEVEGRLILFVVPAPGRELDDGLGEAIRQAIRRELSPRHLPDRLVAVADVPRTLSGKKVEVPVKRLLTGTPAERALTPGALENPEAVDALLTAYREAEAPERS
jgi:acetoacetyl-CoA synthetase